MSDQASGGQRAVDLCSKFELEEAAKTLLEPNQTAQEFLNLLIEREHYNDAAMLLAHMLQPQQGVWWALNCTRQSGVEFTPPMEEALAAAEAWVRAPSPENQLAARGKSEAVMGSGAGLTASGAFWGGGTVRVPEGGDLTPPPFVGCKFVGGAVIASAVATEPQNAQEKIKRAIDLGLEIEKGANHW